MFPALSVLPQYLLPQRALTQFAGWVARAQAGALTTALIRWFVRRYGVNMAEAEQADLAQYSSFNQFFTRALAAGARPLQPATWICPVDGAISQCGPVLQGQLFQAKGHHYSSTALLGGDAELAAEFADGAFATVYLSPRDYHRIHMPCDATLRRMVYVPGDLFSVNPKTARAVPGLFARNERVVCVFDSAHGPLALVLVGATIVGSVATVWHGTVNPPRTPSARVWDYPAGQVVLRQGEEMGRFLLGSTVVLLWPAPGVDFAAAWAPGAAVQLGQRMAEPGAPTRPAVGP